MTGLMRTLAVLAARYGSVFVQFLVVAVVTRTVPRDDAGLYFTLMGVVLATYFLAGFGIPDGLVRHLPAISATGELQQATSLARRSFGASLTSAPIGAVLTGAIALGLTGSIQLAALTAGWWAAYGLIFIGSQLIVARGSATLGSSLFYSSANAGQLLITVPWILLSGATSLEVVMLATACGTGVTALVVTTVALGFARRGQPKARRPHERVPSHLGPVLRDGLWIAAGRVVQAGIIWSPVWAAGLILSLSDAALIGLACRLVSAVAAVIAAVKFSIRPELAARAANGDWETISAKGSRIAFLASVLAVVAAIVSVALGDLVITPVFGGSYMGTGLLVGLLLIGTLGESLGGPVDEVLKMSGSARAVFIAQAVTLPVSFALQVLLGSAYGVIGLAIAYGCSFAAMYGSLVVYLWRRRRVTILPWPRRSRLQSSTNTQLEM